MIRRLVRGLPAFAGGNTRASTLKPAATSAVFLLALTYLLLGGCAIASASANTPAAPGPIVLQPVADGVLTSWQQARLQQVLKARKATDDKGEPASESTEGGKGDEPATTSGQGSNAG